MGLVNLLVSPKQLKSVGFVKDLGQLEKKKKIVLTITGRQPNGQGICYLNEADPEKAKPLVGGRKVVGAEQVSAWPSCQRTNFSQLGLFVLMNTLMHKEGIIPWQLK